MNISRVFYLSLSLFMSMTLASCTLQKSAQPAAKASSQEVLQIINQVNQYWQANNPAEKWAMWDVVAYHTGNMEVYGITKNPAYKQYSERWAVHNQWMGAKSTEKEKWKYAYGEKDDYVLFGDWQICFQTYIDLYNLDKDEKKIARALEVMDYQMQTAKSDYWWWADGLYMVMPVMTKLYKVTGNKLYLDKIYEYWKFADQLMYDADEKLYYRNAKYIYPKHKSVNGKKDFWARGDGWVFAGLAKVLQDLPKNDQHRAEYLQRFTAMAEKIKLSQQAEGYWTRSLLDPTHAPGPETSGTAFFVYGMLWGIRNNVLPAKVYEPVAQKGWKYLSNIALQPDGKIGYVQPIGERAIPGQLVDKNSTASFGVGAFLLASAEMYRHQLSKGSN
ncbi:glycoside hydrolase family 88/105 protein [Pedobacter sp.]|uniref:glycoside hydrolase family 88/105 protein n=1 Tax=Pedobacter sp. TaxID=1411316 RepID=UPI003D7F70B7